MATNGDAPKVDADGNPLPEVPSNIDEEMAEDMAKLWKVFQDPETGNAKIEELGTILRALDVNLPDEAAFEEVRHMVDPEGKGYFDEPGLKIVMEEKLKEEHTVEDMTGMLSLLDKDGEGLIPTPRFNQYMMNMGHKMTEEEVDELLKEADPKNDGVVNIADLADRLCPPKK